MIANILVVLTKPDFLALLPLHERISPKVGGNVVQSVPAPLVHTFSVNVIAQGKVTKVTLTGD